MLKVFCHDGHIPAEKLTQLFFFSESWVELIVNKELNWFIGSYTNYFPQMESTVRGIRS